MTNEQMMNVLEKYTDESLLPAVREAHEMAIKQLVVLAKLKKLLVKSIENGDPYFINEILDSYGCHYCDKRNNGRCPVEDEDRCDQTPEDTLETFIKYGLDKESNPDLMLHTDDGKDVCTECLAKLVKQHFKFEKIADSVNEQAPLPSKKGKKPAQVDEKALIADHKAGMTNKDLKEKYKVGTIHLKEILDKAKPAEKEPDLGKAQALRNAGWTPKEIAEECRTTEDMVEEKTVKPEKKQKKKPFEWAEDMPDVLTQGGTELI